jgi:hypothetical protein
MKSTHGVGRHHLLIGDLPGHPAREAAATRQDPDDHTSVVPGPSTDGHPVAHCRQFTAARRAVLQASDSTAIELVRVHVQPVDVVELDGDTARLNVGVVAPRFEAARELLVPAQVRRGEMLSGPLPTSSLSLYMASGDGPALSGSGSGD